VIYKEHLAGVLLVFYVLFGWCFMCYLVGVLCVQHYILSNWSRKNSNEGLSRSGSTQLLEDTHLTNRPCLEK